MMGLLCEANGQGCGREKETKGDFITDLRQKHKNPFNLYLLSGVFIHITESSIRNKEEKKK